ncbi:MAG: hypothetical protein R6W76_16310, partial [Caldilinea sp.]
MLMEGLGDWRLEIGGCYAVKPISNLQSLASNRLSQLQSCSKIAVMTGQFSAPSNGLPQTGKPRVALVHDWLNQMGGAENVLEELVTLFPGAPVYTSMVDRQT